jgi:hypothetical protein
MALIAAMPDDFLPVSVEIRPGSFRTIRTVQQASVLTWPQGRRRLLAMKACLASLEERRRLRTRASASSKPPRRRACS